MKTLEHNLQTGEVFERDLTSEEIAMAAEISAKLAEEAEAFQQANSERLALAQNLLGLKTSARAKLIAGTPLTEEEADAILGGI